MSMPDAPVVLPTPLNDALISKLAREVARQIIPIPNLLTTFKLSQSQFDQLIDTPMFHQRLIEEQAIWNASDAMSIASRIKSKASTMIEELLLDAYTLVQDPEQPMSAKVEMLKWASRLAGLTDNPNIKGGGAAEDSRVKITINIGGNKLEFDKEKLPERVISGDVVDLTPSNAS
jgi:hypothetical protein